MTSQQTQPWFVEVHQQDGSSFGFTIKEHLHHEKTPYQSIDIYDTTHFGRLMVIDGCVMLTDRDNFLYHEMMSHPALFTHDGAEHIAIIGGGDCGTLKEVLKHKNVQSVIQIDIDERVTRLSEQYFPELCSSNHDPRAKLQFIDGIAWMKEQAENSLDLIIVDSTDPVGPAKGLFAVEFYADCYNALKPGGILVQQSESPLYHAESIIKPIHNDMRSAGFAATQTLLFPQPVYPSGWWSCTMGGKSRELSNWRQNDAKSTQLKTRYYNHAIHQAALAQPNFMQDLLGSNGVK